MTKKSRDYKKVIRARKNYSKVMDRAEPYSYTHEMLMADLRLKYEIRIFYSKYPKPIPKVKYVYEN